MSKPKRTPVKKTKAEISRINTGNIAKRSPYKKVSVTSEKNGPLNKRFKYKFTKVSSMPIKDISVKPEIFQGRTVPFASETVEKIVNEGYDTSQEPIILFKDKNQNIVISGHSRFEAAKRLSAKNKKFTKVPVKFFIGDIDEAIDYAVIESNRSGKAEGIESDIKAYLRAKTRGYNKEFLKGIFKSDAYISILRALSFLNAKGKFIEFLSKGMENETKSFPYLIRNSVWAGTLRKIHPELTDKNESEIFDFFYKSKKGLKVSKQTIFDLVEKRVNNPRFKKYGVLQLEAEKEFNFIKETDPAVVKLRQLERNVLDLANDRMKAEQKLKFKEADDLTGALRRKLPELNKLKSDIFKEEERLESGGLFS